MNRRRLIKMEKILSYFRLGRWSPSILFSVTKVVFCVRRDVCSSLLLITIKSFLLLTPSLSFPVLDSGFSLRHHNHRERIEDAEAMHSSLLSFLLNLHNAHIHYSSPSSSLRSSSSSTASSRVSRIIIVKFSLSLSFTRYFLSISLLFEYKLLFSQHFYFFILSKS